MFKNHQKYESCHLNKNAMESSGRSKINKHAASKIVMNAELDNRMKEEQQMWKQHKKMQQKAEKKKRKPRKRKHSPSTSSSSDQSSSDHEVVQVTTVSNSNPVKPCERWGHSGFIELYPEDAISGKMFEESSPERKPRKTKKKKKHKQSKHKKKKDR